jgi:hypothetical protein
MQPSNRLLLLVLSASIGQVWGQTCSAAAANMAAINKDLLLETVRLMSAPGKGLLAADESTATVGKRVRHRHAY